MQSGACKPIRESERMKILRALVPLMIAITAHAGDAVQSAASYEAAIRGSFVNVTTSPAYVMITAVNANTGEEHLTCTTANFLSGAIQKESGLQFDAQGLRKAEALALSNEAHRFIFSNEEAWRNISPFFSDQELAEVRERFSSFSDKELRRGISEIPRDIGYDDSARRRYKSAVACFLIERGLSPYRADITGAVNVK